MSRRKPLAALAAVTAALGLVVPTASAGAATIQPAVPSPIVSHVGYPPSPLLCNILVLQLQAAVRAGNPFLANALAKTLMYMGCGGAAI
jgi:hypothetical protein